MFKKLAKKLYVSFLAIALLAPIAAEAAPILWAGDSSGRLGTVDVATGNVNVIGSMGAVMTDIAFDPAGDLWGITFSGLYKIDKNTAASTFVGSLGTSVNSLVFDSAGVLYTANNSLYTINTTTGAASLVGSGGGVYTSSGDLAFVGGELFLSSSGVADSLIKLDTTNGSGSVVGSIGFGSVFGLASPNGTDLFGMSGTTVLSINALTGSGSAILDFSGKGLGPAFGTAFVTEASAVPIPAAAWLFGTALVGFIGFSRRRNIQ